MILIKVDDYYEPIYSYQSGKTLKIIKQFFERDSSLPLRTKLMFKELIIPFFNEMCKPLDSMTSTIYKVKRSLMINELIKILKYYKYIPDKLVINYNNKIVGVTAKDGEGITGFIPCYPSAIDLKATQNYIFMDDFSIWNSYKDTVEFLNRLNKRSKKRLENKPETIPCKPAFKIIEEELVVGILTNTNQFIQISPPLRNDEIDRKIDLPAITDQNYMIQSKTNPSKMIQGDSIIETQTTVDVEREDYIKKIKLETSFYNVFRNTIRLLLNDYNNYKIRTTIESQMSNKYIIYSDKLKKMDELLRQLVGDKIQFIGDNDYYKHINNVSTCIIKDINKCKDTPNLCIVSDNGKCNLILPKKNLITEHSNKQIYFGRMSDELIRYNRINSFMLQSNTYLAFNNIGYNLKDNEFIITQSALMDYFDKLIVPSITNKYVKYNSYDEVKPIITQPYNNKIDNDSSTKTNCDKTEKSQIKSSVWKSCFPETYGETEYTSTNIYCTFEFIIELIERHNPTTKYTMNDIKKILVDEYLLYTPNHIDKIIDILIIEGKHTLGKQVKSKLITFSDFIYMDKYFITPFDIWLIVNKLKIPTILISNSVTLQTIKDNFFICYGTETDRFVFIVIPGLKSEHIPLFKLIKDDKGNIFIPLENIKQDCKKKANIEQSLLSKMNIENYLTNFKLPIKKNKKEIPLIRLLIDENSSP